MSRRPRAARAALLALAMTAPSCSERPLTQLVVVADVDLLVPSQVDGLEIEIVPPEGSPVHRTGELDGPDAVTLPASLGVVHRGGALGPIAITATALRGTEPIVVREAEVYFVEGRTLVLELHLEAACVGIPCPDRETCSGGACRTVVVGREELVDWDGVLPHLDDAGSGCVAVPEICNRADDDCDGRTDEGIDLSSNPFHCGICDNACPPRPGAEPACVGGLCTIACGENLGDCNGDPRDGCEVQLTSVSMCAACGETCSVAHGLPTCFLGTCEVQSCAPGWGDCNGESTDGCEAPLNDPAHCGACTPCVVPGATASCVDGTCGVAACSPGLGNCNGLVSDGCETRLDTVAACGACGRACPAVAAGTAGCAGGACVIERCDALFADCDGSVSNGCETRLDTMSDCGACGAPCALEHASEVCGASGCAIGACEAGWGDCNGLPGDGCETSLETAADCGRCGTTCTGATPLCGRSGATRACASACSGALTMCGGGCVDLGTSLAHCGACDRACAPAHAAGECRAGSCAIATCDPGWGDCNGMAADGCETPLDTMASCGACGRACDLAFASERCDAGRCLLVSCDPLRGDCDATAATGCETDLATSGNCGSCGATCTLAGASSSCATGACEIVSCAAGRGDCDGLKTNGCETTLGTLTDCRACGDVCDVPRATESCATGACTRSMCDTGWADCNGMAADGCETPLDTLVDCGTCGTPCGPFANATASCAARTCARTCNPGWGDCNGMAADGCETPLTTSANCGACGTACTGSTSVCGPSGGGVACISGCAAGQMLCSTECADTLTDERHCGACDTPCAPPHAEGVCIAGACRIASCMSGWGDCNGSMADGCERDLRTAGDCGACGVACSAAANATASCATGTCVRTCSATFADCDGVAANGCERAIDTTMNCGACNAGCAGVPQATSVECVAGECRVATCSALRGDCNGLYSDGCETNLRNNDANCGACGRPCGSGESCQSGTCR